MGSLVIVAYQPKSGKDKALEALVKDHYNRLKKIDLVSPRKPIIGKAADGSVIEIFEWKSKEAIEQAHNHPEVQKMWSEFEEVCTYLPAARVQGLDQLFSALEPLN